MSSHGSCVRCSRVLEVESASGLCPSCLRTIGSAVDTFDIPAPTPAPAPVPVDRTQTFGNQSDTLTLPPAAQRVPLPPAPAGYELIEELGCGGMGVVYLARDHTTEQLVAMKFLQRPGSQAAYDRFLIELRAVAGLNHPHIIRLLGHDFLRADPFFVTEYAAGGSLSKKLEAEGPLAPRAAAELMATVARAVHAANAAHVVHRDLKPSNILLAADGSPRVSDFGLAKRTDRDDQATLGSGALGTPAYMATEQTRGKDATVDERTDVYGLGATLYHIVTGRPPFTGPHDEVIRRVVTEPPVPPRAVRRDLPIELEAVILKCLEKDPARRYASAEALAADLDRFLAGQVPEAPLLTWPRRVALCVRRHRRALAVAGGVALLVVAAVAIWLATRPVDPQDRIRAELKAGRSAHILFESGYPDWLKENWLVHPAPLGQSVAAGGACAFESIHPSLLAFLKDPGIDSYRVTAELRIMRSALVTDPKQPPNLQEFARSGVGLFLGHVAARGGDGTEAHGFLLVDYSDYVPTQFAEVGVTEAAVQPGGMLIVVRPDAPVANPHWGWYPVTRFPPAAGLPGEWRVIRVEVRPTGVKFYWAEHPDKPFQLLAEASAEMIRKNYADLQGWLDKYRPASAIVLPAWNTRAPFGVWSRSSAVAVRNVVVEPLPNPE